MNPELWKKKLAAWQSTHPCLAPAATASDWTAEHLPGAVTRHQLGGEGVVPPQVKTARTGRRRMRERWITS